MNRLIERNIELADPESIVMFRSMTSVQKVRAMNDMHDAASRWVHNAVRRRYPDWSKEQIQVEVGRRMRGEISRNR